MQAAHRQCGAMAEISGHRSSNLRPIPGHHVQEARAKELKAELLNSEKLKVGV